MPIALLLLLLIGGGTGVVAENSLPGDTLYPIKININEKLESALALTAKAEAKVSVHQAAKRLVEAEKLKEKGSLSAEQSIEIKNSFLKEVDLINENVLKIRAKGDSKSADEIDSDFKREINNHSEIAVNIGVESEDSDDDSKSKVSLTSSVKSSNSEVVKKTERRDDDSDDENESEDEDDDDSRSNTTRVTTGVSVPNVSVSASAGSTLLKYTLAQVSAHNSASDCWSVVSGGVYNLTAWISQHPGGQSAIKGMCGVDATASFVAQHGGQGNPAAELASFKIGVI